MVGAFASGDPYLTFHGVHRSGRAVVTVIRSFILGRRFDPVLLQYQYRSRKSEMIITSRTGTDKMNAEPGDPYLSSYMSHTNQTYTHTDSLGSNIYLTSFQ